MKKLLLFAASTLICHLQQAYAAVSVTPASGGANICANMALGGSTPGYTTLGTITVSEGLTNDIAPGTPRVLVLNAPAGWQFNNAVTPTLNFTFGRNITGMSVGAFTATSLTINLNVTGITLIDVFTIAGLQLRANSSASAAGNITSSTVTGFAGITAGVTNFGSLSLTPSLTPSVSIGAAPSLSVCAGSNITFSANPVNGGTPTFQWQLNGSPVAGATNTTFASATLADADVVGVVMGATGCVAPTFATAVSTVTINAVPAAVPVAGAGTFCSDATITAGPSSGGTIFYQGTTYNGTSTVNASTSEIVNLPGSFTYYFRERSAAGCWGASSPVKVKIQLPPGAVTISPAAGTVCLGDSTGFSAFATAPDVEVLEEDFNAGLGSFTITNIAGTPLSYWQPKNPPGHASATQGDGTPYIQSSPDATSSGVITNTILTSPSFSLVGYTAATLTFNQYYRFWTGDIDVVVEYSPDGGSSWLPLINQIGGNVGTPAWVPTAATTTVALPAAAIGQPDVQVRWRYNNNYGWYWTVDNVKVNAVPTLTYNWAGVSGASGLSCSTCDTVTITPAVAGANVYTITTSVAGCESGTSVTVTANPLPVAYNVTGGGNYCIGGTGVLVGLDGSDAGVNYQLMNGGMTVGAPMAGTGAAFDFPPALVAGTYTVTATDGTTGCTGPMNDSAVVVIDTLPSPITGPASICLGSTVTLASTTAGGTWTSSDVAVVSVGASTGDATGVSVGTADITYTAATSCFVTQEVTVTALPAIAPITGITNLCVGGSTTLSNSTPGGIWSSDDASVASIDAAGLVNAVAAGITTISYSVTDGLGCSDTVTTADTVTAFPAVPAIGGPAAVCFGSTVTLTNAMAGGTWTSANPAVAAIGASSGDVTGIAAGTADITYTVTVYPGCSTDVSRVQTVNALPVIDTISGGTSLCAGATTLLANATPGGVWSSSDNTIATVGPTGVVTGVAMGGATITYTVTNAEGCSDFVTRNITVGSAIGGLAVLPASPSVTLCNGNPVNLVLAGASAGLTYQWSVGGADIAGATNGSYIATVPGMYAITVNNGSCSVTLPSKNVIAPPVASITYNTTGNYLYTGTFTAYQWFRNGTAIAGATSGMYMSPVAGTYKVVVYDVNGCTDTSADYVMLPTGITGTGAPMNIKVYPNPASSVIYIDAPVKINVTVTSPDGRTVKANAATGHVSIGDLPNGVYMLLIYDEQHTLLRTERFSKID